MTYPHNGNFLADAIAVMILLLMPMALPIIRSIPGFNLSKMSSIGGAMISISLVVLDIIPCKTSEAPPQIIKDRLTPFLLK